MIVALYVVTALNVLISAGFAIGGFLRPSLLAPGPMTELSRIYALFGVARVLPLALVTLCAIAFGPLAAVQWIGAIAGLAQLADFAIIGFAQRKLDRAVGPLVIAIAQFVLIALTLNSGA